MFYFNNILDYFLIFLLAFSVSFILAPLFLKILINLNFGQQVREEGPQSHLKKSGTPTMGGIIFILSSIISLIIVVRPLNFNIILMIIFMLSFGFIGFMDDYVKVINKRNLGLTEKQKLILQIILGIILSLLTLKVNKFDTNLFLPFTSHKLNIGLLYIPLTTITIIATVNSVNLTDGLDGLATSVTSIVMLTLGCIAFNYSFFSIANYSFAVAGACLGFLRINKYPAKAFMGDTGSMALGGAVCTTAILMNMHFIIIFIGFIYVIESLSVIIQVYFFKKYKKRIFKMSPFHHHLELCGYSEVKIVILFCLVTCIFAVISIFATSFV